MKREDAANSNNNRCAYCGEEGFELTRDHVVPKALWKEGKELPPQMVIVPACVSCQKKWDLQAEYFRMTLLMMIDRGAYPVADRVLEGPVIRSINRRLESNNEAIAAFFRNMRTLPRTSPGGIITGFGETFPLDIRRFTMIPEKIVRGLFFCKSGAPLPGNYVVSVFPDDRFWDMPSFQHIQSLMVPWADLGDDVFQVRWYNNHPSCTAWLLLFYGQIAMFAWTELAATPSVTL